MKNLKKLFNPKSIAVVGASPKKKKLGNILIENIRKGGWKGKLYCVNPKHKKIGQNKCHASLDKIKKPVDLVLVAIPAPFVNRVLEEGSRTKPKIENYVIISAGFRETGKRGRKLEEELKETAKKNKLNILGPNCLGFINASRNLNATFTSARVKRGKIAVVSQSGALEVALLDWAEKHEAGFSKVISIGNKSVVGETEIIRYLNEDRETGAIALYLEDVKDGAGFISAVSEINCRKPVAVIKAGKSRAGQKAIASHTGSLAQDEHVVRAVFDKFGIVSADSIERFQDIISYLEYNEIPQNDEIVIITNAGGLGVLSADFIGSADGIKLLDLPEKTKRLLKKILPSGASAANPIDILGDASPRRYREAIEAVAPKFRKHPLLALLTPQNQTNPLKVAKILGSYRRKFPSLCASFVGGAKIEKALTELEKKKVPNFESPERALAAIRELSKQKKCARNIFSPVAKKAIRLKLKTNRILEKAGSEKRKMLFWKEAETVFREYGLALAKTQSAEKFRDLDAEKTKFPCALKTDDPKIFHRWDKKAVALNIKNEKDLKAAWKKMKKRTGAGHFLVQPMAKPGLEIIVGMKRDGNFGPVVVVGWGGTFTEIFKDRVIFVPPLSKKEILDKLRELEIYPILKGFRGEKGYRTDEIAKIVLLLQEIAAENPDVAQIDINPAMLYNNGKKYQVLDAKVFLK